MTDYTALADRLVALGVGNSYENEFGIWYVYPGSRFKDNYGESADKFCHDGRVVLAAMEKCGNGFSYVLCVDRWSVYETDENGEESVLAVDKSLPIAILTACCDALEGK